MGTPALFDKTIFAAILALTGGMGANGIIKANPAWIDTVDFPRVNFDIDTDQEYAALVAQPS